MRILRVQLTNIKSYAEQTVELAAGTNSICGQNGAGKTTILEGIGWALFNSLPYNQKQFIRDGASWGQVAVTFTARDGREYQVVRRATRSGSGGHWYVFDLEVHAKIADGSADVGEWLKHQLGTEDAAAPSVLFENAVGVPQGGLCAPFLQSAEKRKASFNPILRVHEYSQAAEKLRDTRSHLQSAIRDQEELAGRHAVEADKIPALHDEIRGVQGVIGAASRGLEDTRKAQEQIADRIRALEAEEKRIGDLKSNVSHLRQSLANRQESQRRAQQSVDAAWRAHETVERSMRGHNLYLAAERKLREIAPAYEQYRRLSDDLTTACAALQREATALEGLVGKIAAAEAAAAQLPTLQERSEESSGLARTIDGLEWEAGRLPALNDQLKTVAAQLLDGRRELEGTVAEIERIERLRPEAKRAPELRTERDAAALRLEPARQASVGVKDLTAKEAATSVRLAKAEARLRELTEKARVDPETEQIAGDVDARKTRLTAAAERVVQLREEYATARARKEAEVVACPLSRNDCLTLQRQAVREDRYGQDMDRIRREGKLANELQQRCKGEVEVAESAAARLAEARSYLSTIETQQQMTEDLRAQAVELGEQIAALKTQAAALPALQRELAALTTELQRAEQSVTEVGRLPDLERAEQRQTGHIKERERARAEMESEIQRIQAITQDLEAHRRRADQLRNATAEYHAARVLSDSLPSLQADHEKLSTEHDTLSDRMETLRRDVAALEGVGREKQAAERSLVEHREAHDQYLGNLALADELPARQVELKGIETEVAKATAELSAKESALEEALASWDPAALVAARATGDALANRAGDLAATIRAKEARLADVRLSLSYCEEQARRRDLALQEAGRLGTLLDTLEFARKTIKEAQAPVTEALLHGVSHEARGIFADILDDHSVRLNWTPEYEIQIERGAERLTFNQMSGGEQMSAALAVRLALLKKLSDIDIAFLDEPTQNMDESRRTNLAAQVGTLRGFEQLFVISHDDTFERQVQHAIVVRKSNGDSVVTYGHESGDGTAL